MIEFAFCFCTAGIFKHAMHVFPVTLSIGFLAFAFLFRVFVIVTLGSRHASFYSSARFSQNRLSPYVWNWSFGRDRHEGGVWQIGRSLSGTVGGEFLLLYSDSGSL